MSKRRRLILGGGAVVLVAALLTWLLAFSSVFGVRTVEVTGTHTLTATQIRTAAAITSGSALLRLDTDAIARRVQVLPDVASAQVSTSFPATVHIAVTERVPVGYVKAGTQFGLIDKTGRQYRSVAAAPGTLPQFVVPTGAAASSAAAAVATVAADLPAAVLTKLASIQALDPNAITLLLKDNRIVQWGSADRSVEKARILPALLGQQSTRIDVTDPDQPYLH